MCYEAILDLTTCLQRLVRCECENHFMRSNVTTVSPTVWSCNCVGVWLTMVTVVSGTPACLSESPKLKVSLLPWIRLRESLIRGCADYA